MEPETLADLAELVGLAKRLEHMTVDAISGGWWFSERELAIVHSIARDIEEVVNR